MRVSINIVNSFKKKYNLIVILLGFLQVDMVKKGGSLQWEGMAFTHPFKISALFPRAKRVTVALFITLEVSHFLVWQDVLCWGGGVLQMWRNLFPSFFIWFSPLLPLCTSTANLGIMGLLYAFHIRLWMNAQRPVAREIRWL